MTTLRPRLALSGRQPNKDRLDGNEGHEFPRKNLVQVVVDNMNWKVLHRLHRDRTNGEYLKESFPQSEMHGGGSPVEKTAEDGAKREFQLRRLLH